MADRDSEGAPQPLSADAIKALHRELQANYSARNSGYSHRRSMYEGEHWGQVGLDKPPTQQRRYTLTANYVRPTVDKSVQLLLGQMPAIQVLPPGVDEVSRRTSEAMEAILYYSWDKNSAPITLRRVAFNQILLGQGIVYYWWDATEKCVRWRSIAPDNYYPLYDGEDVIECVLVGTRSTRALQRQYPDLASQIEPDQVGDDVLDEQRYMSQYGPLNPLETGPLSTGSQQEQVTPVGAMTTTLDWFDRFGNHVRVMGKASKSNKFTGGKGKVPVIVFPYSLNGDERETPTEVDEIMDLNLYLDDLLSDTANVIRKYARPTIIDKGSGVSPETVARAVSKEGGVLPIRRDGEIGFLTWEGTPPDVVNQYNRVLSLIYDLSGKPPSAYGNLATNQSGVATNMALSPTTASSEERTSIFGFGLQQLNSAILNLYEHYMKGDVIDVSGSRPTRAGVESMMFYAGSIRGGDIGGWRQTRVRWPSALRTDDPVYVQNELAKMQAQPPAQSVYTTLENLGIEDAEMELDRIQQQLEDPRMHPDRLTAAVGAASALQQGAMPSPIQGLDPNMAADPMDAEMVNNNGVAAGSPNKDELVNTGY